MVVSETLHGQQIFAVSRADIDAAVGPGVVGVVAGNVPTEAGEDRGQPHHVGVGIGGDGIAAALQLLRAVVVELPEADGEQLHDLAGVVLVGIGGGVAFVVAEHVEELTHHRAQGHVLKELAEVAEGVLAQHVVVTGFAAGHALDGRGVVAGDDEQLAQGVLHSFPQLVVAGQSRLPELALDQVVIGAVLLKQSCVALDVAGGAGRIGHHDSLFHGRLRGCFLRY